MKIQTTLQENYIILSASRFLITLLLLGSTLGLCIYSATRHYRYKKHQAHLSAFTYYPSRKKTHCVYLSNLKPLLGSQKYLHIMNDRSVEFETPLRIHGISFQKGIGTHAPSFYTYALDKKYHLFTAVIGIDDTIKDKEPGSVQFLVYGNAEKLFESPILTPHSPPQFIQIPVAGYSYLTLVTKDGGDGYAYDVADWGDAQLIKKSY